MTRRLSLGVLIQAVLVLMLSHCGSDPELPVSDDGAPPRGGSGGQSTGGRDGTDPPLNLGGERPSCEGDACSPGGAGGGPGAICGNGEVEEPEVCDDGNGRSGDGCSGLCRVERDFECPTPGAACVSTVECGDGRLSSGEACDDGNAEPDDGCSDTCKVEQGFACDIPNQACVPAATAECGDGSVNFGEECDDSNAVNDDGCSDACLRESGFSCPTPSEPCERDEACGDGVLNPGEACDDGNTRPGDGCSGGLCRVEVNFECPRPGRPCVSTIVCGDESVSGDEACDDGNQEDGDGCAADCRLSEPGYRCPKDAGVGGPCVLVPAGVCGNSIGDDGEYCDDGNTTPGDGCSQTCTVETGYTCSAAGVACTLRAVCGDGKIDQGEECDDSNADGADGCSARCIQEADFSCREPGEPCVSTVECGDGRISGTETCDDRNGAARDGCSATCQLERGWTCPVGGVCRALLCGDGFRAGREQCDDANVEGDDGCSALCQVEIGYQCAGALGALSLCTATVCGDSMLQGTEQCDDGNLQPFDGCSPTCTNEPVCVTAAGIRQACPAVCGDGAKFPNEVCDDGNLRNGDGCSSTCQQEPGYYCATPAGDPTELVLPVVYRDFAPGAPYADGHPDFEWFYNDWFSGGTYSSAPATAPNRVSGNIFGLTAGLARTALGNNADMAAGALTGRPVFGFTPATCPLPANTLRRNGVSYCAATVQSASSFNEWFRSSDQSTAVPGALTLVRCPRAVTGDPVCAAGDANTFLFDSNTLQPDGSTCGAAGCDGFFPLDEQTGANAARSNDCGAGSPNGQLDQHNFHFTSELRYWFQYRAAANATLTFRGDDDVFVYVNGRLVVDIGGVHEAQLGSVTLNATTRDVSGVLLNLQENSIYEIAVFQAERNVCASNYRLQLENFLLKGTVCTPRCGDGVATADEACDLPTGNTGAYGGCNPDCTLGPFCGDGFRQRGEQCDNGVNTDVYATRMGACAPGCVNPPECGDGAVNGAHGEECDEGALNGSGYPHCTATCQNGPRCGDGVRSNGEACDDAADNGTSTSKCAADCTLKCGNGVIDAGERCDDGAANNTGGYGKCTAQCSFGPRCGDGVKQSNEQCDDGLNDGSYGACAPQCVFGPYCGDGTLQAAAGEECDEGLANSSSAYGPGLCTTLCKEAPYCGDRSVDAGEGCDDGVNNGEPGSCSEDCSTPIPLPRCGNGRLDANEECDEGASNGTVASNCDLRCHIRCGNGVRDAGEECDDGVNDGSYGTCNPDCSVAGFCGDGVKSGLEQCDEGDANESSPYGEGLCTESCTLAPYCGDGRIHTPQEVCDSTAGCGDDCDYVIR